MILAGDLFGKSGPYSLLQAAYAQSRCLGAHVVVHWTRKHCQYSQMHSKFGQKMGPLGPFVAQIWYLPPLTTGDVWIAAGDPGWAM